jgi:hypothetical protein
VCQSHQLIAIPITSCTAKINNKSFINFHIIGENNHVHVIEPKSTCNIT